MMYNCYKLIVRICTTRSFIVLFVFLFHFYSGLIAPGVGMVAPGGMGIMIPGGMGPMNHMLPMMPPRFR